SSTLTRTIRSSGCSTINAFNFCMAEEVTLIIGSPYAPRLTADKPLSSGRSNGHGPPSRYGQSSRRCASLLLHIWTGLADPAPGAHDGGFRRLKRATWSCRRSARPWPCRDLRGLLLPQPDRRHDTTPFVLLPFQPELFRHVVAGQPLG